MTPKPFDQSSCPRGHEDMMWPTMKYLFGLVNELYVIKVMFLEGKREKQISNWRVGHLNLRTWR